MKALRVAAVALAGILLCAGACHAQKALIGGQKLYPTGVWWQHPNNEPREKLDMLRNGGSGWSLIHFKPGSRMRDTWMADIAAAAPDGHVLALSCSSIDECAAMLPLIPDRVDAVLYDLEPATSPAEEIRTAALSIRRMIDVAHGYGRALYMYYDEQLQGEPGWADAVANVDGWLINGAIYELSSVDYGEEIEDAVNRVRGWADKPVVVQLRLAKYDPDAYPGDGWEPWMPAAIREPAGVAALIRPELRVSWLAMDYNDNKPALYAAFLSGAIPTDSITGKVRR